MEQEIVNCVKSNDIVTIDYVGTLNSGQSVLSSEDLGPLRFQVGSFDLIRGLNDAVLGMRVGESKKVAFNPCDAFGDIEEDLIVRVPFSDLPKELEMGMKINDKANDISYLVTAIDKEESMATLDSNHALSGQKLTFEIKVLNIKN